MVAYRQNYRPPCGRATPPIVCGVRRSRRESVHNSDIGVTLPRRCPPGSTESSGVAWWRRGTTPPLPAPVTAGSQCLIHRGAWRLPKASIRRCPSFRSRTPPVRCTFMCGSTSPPRASRRRTQRCAPHRAPSSWPVSVQGTPSPSSFSRPSHTARVSLVRWVGDQVCGRRRLACMFSPTTGAVDAAGRVGCCRRYLCVACGAP